MALVNPVKPVQTVPVEPVRITKPEFKGNTQDTRYTPASNIIAYMEGSRWSVDYFSQVLGTDNNPTGLSPGLSPTSQQYRLIERMELRVVSPLSHSQDTETKDFSIVGEANVYPCLTPTEGDMFVAQVGDGRFGIFQVTNSERKAIFKDSSHSIEYTMVSYMTEDKHVDLLRKVVSNYVFVFDYMKYNQSPLIEKKEYNVLDELYSLYPTMIKGYTKQFFSNEYMTLLVPGQLVVTHDSYATKAIRQICQINESAELQKIRLFNFQEDEAMKALTLWDAIYQGSLNVLEYSVLRTGLVDMRAFRSHPFMRSAYYSRIQQLVYPMKYMSPAGWVDARNNKDSFTMIALSPVKARNNLPPWVEEPDLVEDPVVVVPVDPGKLPVNDAEAILNTPSTIDIHPVTIDDYYVLSEAFYRFNKNTTGPKMSQLEIMVSRMLRGMPIDQTELLRLCKSHNRWGQLEVYYYTPLLLALIKYTVRMI